jgi:hypothetical protein
LQSLHGPCFWQTFQLWKSHLQLQIIEWRIRFMYCLMIVSKVSFIFA